jgi:hypothetical protein
MYLASIVELLIPSSLRKKGVPEESVVNAIVILLSILLIHNLNAFIVPDWVKLILLLRKLCSLQGCHNDKVAR